MRSKGDRETASKPFANRHLLYTFNCYPAFTVTIGMGAEIACRLKRRTLDRKVASSNPGRSGGRIFFSRVNFVC